MLHGSVSLLFAVRIFMNIPFCKMSGSGNDFIIIDNRSRRMEPVDLPAFVRAVCRRSVSVGADGLILIERASPAGCDFAWRFFNADGSEAEMCGNGGRCAARYAVMQGIAGARLSFETRAGIIHADVQNDRVKIELPSPQAGDMNLTVTVDDTPLLLHFINTGVPHVVTFVDQIEEVRVRELGKALRFHQRFQPAGANVNFAAVIGPAHLAVRTYERGVEDETLACGTGSVAAALIASALGHVISPVQVTTRGGETLTAYCDNATFPFGRVYLEGAVRMVCSGEIWEEAYQ
jgi:diaminopimelate epimerase